MLSSMHANVVYFRAVYTVQCCVSCAVRIMLASVQENVVFVCVVRMQIMLASVQENVVFVRVVRVQIMLASVQENVVFVRAVRM